MVTGRPYVLLYAKTRRYAPALDELYVLLVFIGVSSFYSTTYITCPADPKKTLGIKLPFLVMIIKNLKKYFTFEVQVSICMWICTLSTIPERWLVNLWEKSNRRKVSLSFWMYSFLPLLYTWFCHYYYDIISVLVIWVSCKVLKEEVKHPENLINSSKISKLEDWKSISGKLLFNIRLAIVGL